MTGSTWGGIVSVWAPKEKSSRASTSFGSCPKEVYSRVGKKGKEGEEVNKRCVIKAVSMLGAWGLLSQRESLEHTSEVFQLNDEEARIFSNHFSLHGWLKASGTLCCCCSVAQLHPSLATPWTAAWQTSLSFTISWGLLRLRSIESVLPSKHVIFFALLSSCFQSPPASGSFLMRTFYFLFYLYSLQTLHLSLFPDGLASLSLCGKSHRQYRHLPTSNFHTQPLS